MIFVVFFSSISVWFSILYVSRELVILQEEWLIFLFIGGFTFLALALKAQTLSFLYKTSIRKIYCYQVLINYITCINFESMDDSKKQVWEYIIILNISFWSQIGFSKLFWLIEISFHSLRRYKVGGRDGCSGTYAHCGQMEKYIVYT